MNLPKILITAPVHIQPSTEWVHSLELVSKGENVDVLVVDDSNGNVKMPGTFKVFDYTEQEAFLGTDLYEQFEQFHHCAACKQLGLLYGYLRKYDYVMVIDSDCIVPPNFVSEHLKQMEHIATGWQNPLQYGPPAYILNGPEIFSRGFPYSQRSKDVLVNMGLWSHRLDLYGSDRMKLPKWDTEMPPDIETQAYSTIPLSGMNVCFRHSVIPGMLFLPNVGKLTRHDDIWGGYILQEFMRKRRDAIRYGKPVVYHDTIVVPEEDAKDEEQMLLQEDAFYAAVDNVMRSILPGTYEEMMMKFINVVTNITQEPSLKQFVPALKFWKEALEV